MNEITKQEIIDEYKAKCSDALFKGRYVDTVEINQGIKRVQKEVKIRSSIVPIIGWICFYAACLGACYLVWLTR